MKIYNRLILSAVISIICAILNNQFLISKKLSNTNLIIEDYWLINLNNIKTTLELNIIEKKLHNTIYIYNKEVKRIPECNQAKIIELNVNNSLLLTFKLVWIGIDYEAALKCHEIYQKNISDLLNKPEINLEAKILMMTISENELYISQLTPYLLFIVLFGVAFIFTGIKSK